MRLAAFDSFHGGRRVVSCCDGAACCFDCGDCFGGGAGGDDVDWGFEGLGSSGEELDAVSGTAVDGAGFDEFAEGYGGCGV